MTVRRKALVLGLGLSGRSASRLLADEGWEVLAVDAGQSDSLTRVAGELRPLGIDVRLGVSDLPPDPLPLAVVSPGVAIDSPWVKSLRQRNVEILPEFELGWLRHRGSTIAVTGSSGKSCLVKWLAECLQAQGIDAAAAGNIGQPVCDVVRMPQAPDWLVLELSSFQLEQAVRFRAEAGILLNVMPNHLDRHGTLERYVAAKARLFHSARPEDLAILPAGLAALRQQIEQSGRTRCVTFGPEKDAAYCYADGWVLHGGQPLVDLRGTYFGNDILGVNAAAGLAALSAAGVPPSVAQAVARQYRPLPHRMEEIACSGGVRFIDDSKATTLGAMVAALAMNTARVHLIAGGRLKETDLETPKKMLEARAAGVYLLGESASRLKAAWENTIPCRDCGDLETAVRAAASRAREGEVVLLSPGCASFDQFRSYAERGERFRAFVSDWLSYKAKQ